MAKLYPPFSQTDISLLAKYLPAKALPYCLRLCAQHPFVLTLSRPRQTKLGDYKYHHPTRQHFISVNNNLPPQAFLVTFLHEVAHMLVVKECVRPGKPHGPSWQKRFRRLMEPVMHMQVFSAEAQQALQQHLTNIKASSSADPALYAALNPQAHQHLLGGLVQGQFYTHQGQQYEVVKVNRTRSLCSQIATNRLYSVPHTMQVQPISPPSRQAAPTANIPEGSSLISLAEGTQFTWQGSQWLLQAKRRTRAVCLHIASQKTYTISMRVVVQPC